MTDVFYRMQPLFRGISVVTVGACASLLLATSGRGMGILGGVLGRA